MAIEQKVITAVDAKEGWVTFADPDDPARTFRRTIEAHLIGSDGRKPAVGDVYRFRTYVDREKITYFYYAREGDKG